MSLFFKKTPVPISNEIIEINTVQLWQVMWYSRHGEYSHDISKEFEVFTSEKEANDFAESLRAAFKLIRHTSRPEVEVRKRQ